MAHSSGTLPAAASVPELGNHGPARSAYSAFFGRWAGTWLALPFPLGLLLLWGVSAHYGWVAPQVLPSPQAVLATFIDLAQSGELWDNLWISLLRVLAGFGVGVIGGLLLGVAMGLSPLFKDYTYPFFKAFSQVPVLGWLPLLMLLVGIDEALKIILIAKAALVPIAVNTYKGIENVPSRYVEVARVLQFSRWQLLWRVVFPAALPPVWNGVRYGFTHAWLALVVVELLASSEGLGYMIVFGRQLFQLDVVIAAVAVVGVVGYLGDQLLARIEVILLGWRRSGF